MIEKIFAYLKSRNSVVSSAELVTQVLNIHQATDVISNAILQRLLKQDRRFLWNGTDGWRINPLYRENPVAEELISQTEFTAVHLETCKRNRNYSEIATIAAARIKAGKVSNRFYGFTEAAAPLDHTLAGYARETLLKNFCRFMDGSFFTSFNPKQDLQILNSQSAQRILPERVPVISLRDLARNLFPDDQLRTLEEISSKFGIQIADALDPQTKLDVLTETVFHTFETLEDLEIVTLQGLLELEKAELTFTEHPNFPKSFLWEMPDKPGVYFFRNSAGEILYVGKAKNLKARINSYFYRSGKASDKVEKLLSSSHDLQYDTTGSELEALLLESKLIKELKPPINMQVEIHERVASYGKTNNLILVLPSKQEGYLELFLISHAGAFEQCSARTDLQNIDAVRKKVKKFFFTRKAKADAVGWEREICSSWLQKRRDQVNYIDVESTASLDDCMRILKAHIREPGAYPGRVIHR